MADTTFTRIDRKQLHEVVVQQLRDLIDRGALQPGQRLPAERELADSLGVSRAVLREALRVLEASGMIVTRHGVGRTVRSLPGVNVSGRPLSDVLELVTIDEVLEARIALECSAVELACTKRNDEELAKLRQAAANCETWQDNLAFHVAVAAAAKNYVMESLIREQMEILERLRQRERYDSRQDARELIHDHSSIVDAIEAQDMELGRRLMREHLMHTREAVSTLPRTQRD